LGGGQGRAGIAAVVAEPKVAVVLVGVYKVLLAVVVPIADQQAGTGAPVDQGAAGGKTLTGAECRRGVRPDVQEQPDPAPAVGDQQILLAVVVPVADIVSCVAAVVLGAEHLAVGVNPLTGGEHREQIVVQVLEVPEVPVRVRGDQVFPAVVIPVIGSHAVLADGIAHLKLLGVRRATRRVPPDELGRGRRPHVLVQFPVVPWGLRRGHRHAFPELSDHEIGQAVAGEVGHLHARMGVGDVDGFGQGDHLPRGEGRIRSRHGGVGVEEHVDRAGLRAGEEVEVAVGVDVRGLEAGIGQLDVRAGGLDGHRVVRDHIGAVEAHVAVQVAAVVGGDEGVEVVIPVAVPVANEGDRREPAALVKRGPGLRLDRATVHEGDQPAGRGGVLEVRDLSFVGAVLETGEQVAVAVAVPIVKRHRHPRPVAVCPRQDQQVAAGGEPAAIDEAVAAAVLVAEHERFDAGLEQVQVSVAVQIVEAVEVAGTDLPPLETLAEEVAVTDQAVIALRLAQAGLDGVEIDCVQRVSLAGHHEAQCHAVDVPVSIDPPGQQVLLVSGAAGVVHRGCSGGVVGHHLQRALVERAGPALVGQGLDEVDVEAGGRV